MLSTCFHVYSLWNIRYKTGAVLPDRHISEFSGSSAKKDRNWNLTCWFTSFDQAFLVTVKYIIISGMLAVGRVQLLSCRHVVFFCYLAEHLFICNKQLFNHADIGWRSFGQTLVFIWVGFCRQQLPATLFWWDATVATPPTDFGQNCSCSVEMVRSAYPNQQCGTEHRFKKGVFVFSCSFLNGE